MMNITFLSVVSIWSHSWNKALGHVKSKDLINWERMPVAIIPTESYESHGAYSGSAIVKDGLLHLLYTGNIKSLMIPVMQNNVWQQWIHNIR